MRSGILLGMSRRTDRDCPLPAGDECRGVGAGARGPHAEQRREFVSVTPRGNRWRRWSSRSKTANSSAPLGASGNRAARRFSGRRDGGRMPTSTPQCRLACAAARGTRRRGHSHDAGLVAGPRMPRSRQVLAAAGFARLADLMYLQLGSGDCSKKAQATPLQFEPYGESQRERFVALDRSNLRGDARLSIDWAASGRWTKCSTATARPAAFRPENWLLVRSDGADVGVLLLAEHRAARHWELLYMGLAPRARGRKLGRDVVRSRAAHGARRGCGTNRVGRRRRKHSRDQDVQRNRIRRVGSPHCVRALRDEDSQSQKSP